MKILYNLAQPWQVGFQEEASPIAAGIVDFHNYTFFYLIIITSFVSYLVGARLFSSRAINWLRSFNHSSFIEIIWTITPGLILLLIAIPSLKLLYSMDEVLNPVLTLKAIGNQWFWSYEINDFIDTNIAFDSYTLSTSDLLPGQLRLLDVDNPIFLPILLPIRLLVSAQDVIHSFSLPSFGLKIDAIPGRINHAPIFILKAGTYYGFCTELCGAAHHNMSIVINAVPYSHFLNWLSAF